MNMTRFLFVGFIMLAFLLPALAVTSQSELTSRGRNSGVIAMGKPGGGGGTTGGVPVTGQRYALIIGISDYDGSSSDLQYADDDARDMDAFFRSQGYTTKVLIDGQATKASILSGFQWLASMENEAGDGVAIAYSGHGYYSNQVRQSGFVAWELVLVTSSEIKAITSTFQSQHVFFFDDACNQGTMSTLVQAGWVAGIGSTTKSYTYDGDSSMQNGIFTYYFLQSTSTTVEARTQYAVTNFNAATPGHATLYDSFTNNMHLRLDNILGPER
jgi:hypothetical protein